MKRGLVVVALMLIFIVGVQVGIRKGRELAREEFKAERLENLRDLESCWADLDDVREGWQRTSATLVECQKDRRDLRNGFAR